MRSNIAMLGGTAIAFILFACSSSDFTGAAANKATNATRAATLPTTDTATGSSTDVIGTASDTGTNSASSTGTEANTVYVPLGGSKVLGVTTACTPADPTIASCSDGVVTGNKVGTTTVDSSGAATTVVVFDPNNPPPQVLAGTATETPPTAAQVAATNTASIDATCAATTPASNQTEFIFPTKATLANPLATACENGFEVNNTPGTMTVTSAKGSRAVTLAIDFGAYLAPNFFRIQASGPFGQNVTVLDSCRMRSACYGDPTSGTCRPPEDSIRSFNVNIPAGATSLTFFLDNSSPFYVRVLGLCDFDLSQVTTFLTKQGGTGSFRLVTGPTGSMMCSATVKATWTALAAAIAGTTPSSLACTATP